MKAPAGLKTPVGLVTAALTAAILLALSLLIATSTHGEETVFGSSAGELEVRTFARGLVHPWSLAFLPDGKMLVTERPGRMRIVTAEGLLSPPLKGVPEVWASGQGGLLDVAVDKSFSQNKTIYFCFAERTGGGGRTAVARAKLNDDNGRLDDTKIIFRQEGPLSSGNHYGCRIVQADDGNLFVALGEHFTYRDQAQNLDNHLGKLIRIAPDGSVPSGNPFIGRSDARPEIWSYGHRNEQGLAINPATGDLWEIEHGPRGGDEVNIIGKGKNYGWPVIGYGIDYSGAKNPRQHGQRRHGAAGQILGAVDRAVRHAVLYRKAVSEMVRQPVHRRAGRHHAGAPVAERKYRNGRRTIAAKSARANSRRPAGAGRRALASDRQFSRTDRAGGTYRKITRFK